MSYNIDKFKVKRLINLAIPVDALYESERTDWHPVPDIRNIETGSVELKCGCEQRIDGIVANGVLLVTAIDMAGEGSGSFINIVLENALKKSSGELAAVCVWEGGDSINRLLVENGQVDWVEIEL